jgi:hypothetical protein
LPNNPHRSGVAATNAVAASAARKTLCALLTSAIDDATEVERLAELVRITAASSTEKDKHSRCAKACDVRATGMVESPNLHLSPQQDIWVRNASTSENVQAIDIAEAESLQLSPQQDSWTRNARISEIYSVA